ncbi:hypothetical protein [Dyella sp.]|uniref:hypothetical protein n=1 Tax=Dyella sp. TaxID=1869338 RepID=UPI002D790028|nr:hypothetical protein [Dyella sp.]
MKIMLMASLTMASSATIATAQQNASRDPRLIDEPEAVIQWGGQNWRIPPGFSMVGHQSEQLWIQLGWIKKNNTVIPASVRGYDLLLDIKVRKENNEDPRNGLATLRRIGATITNLPQLASAHLPGLTYLGTSEGAHYFLMADRDAYMECRSMPVKALIPPYVPNEPLLCETTFHLSNGLFAWVEIVYVKLADAKQGFDVAYDSLTNFLIR